MEFIISKIIRSVYFLVPHTKTVVYLDTHCLCLNTKYLSGINLKNNFSALTLC